MIVKIFLTSGAILSNQADLLNYKNEVIDRLIKLENERENLTNIDDLYNRCIEIVTAMVKFGLVSKT